MKNIYKIKIFFPQNCSVENNFSKKLFAAKPELKRQESDDIVEEEDSEEEIDDDEPEDIIGEARSFFAGFQNPK